MSLTRLNLRPQSASYSAKDNKEVVAVQLDGGASRYRRDILNATSIVNVQWVLTDVEYRYIRIFYKEIIKSGALPFEIELIINDSEVELHKAYMVPGSFALKRQRGLSYTVGARLEAYPIAKDSDEDLQFALLFSEFGVDYEDVFPSLEDELNTLINTNLPAYL